MVYDDAPDTVGYNYVKIFDTPGYRNPSRDDSRQYELMSNCSVFTFRGNLHGSSFIYVSTI